MPRSKNADNTLDRLTAALASPDTDSDVSLYCRLIGIEPEVFGSLILDIGSSRNLVFAQEMATLGSKVVSLNPKFIRKSERPVSQTKREVDSDLCIAALAQFLPFNESVFDTVVAVGSVPIYLPRQDYKACINQIVRVLKPGARAWLTPIYEFPESDFSEELFINSLEAIKGADHSVHKMKSKKGTPYKTIEIVKDKS